MNTAQLTMRQAQKIVRKVYPFAVSFQDGPFYGWAILVSQGSNVALVLKQRDEETAWVAAASLIEEREHSV